MQTQLRVGKKSTAFTIVEIMTVIVIIAVLIATGIPAMESLLRNTQSITTASRLASSLRLAKSEAIKRGLPVTVCPISASFNPNVPFSENTEEWPCEDITTWVAWKVFVDPNFNATEDFSNGETPIIEYVSNHDGAPVTSSISGYITFDPMGFANIDPLTTRVGWTWNATYSGGAWEWNNDYSSEYTGVYSRTFEIAPEGCTGNNARVLEITQNGVIKISNTGC